MYLLFDIGGTNTRVAISLDGNNLDSSKKFPTPQNFSEGMKLIIEAGKQLAGGREIKGLGGGIREVLDNEKSKLVTDPKSSVLPDWIQKPLKQTLQDGLKVPVFIENDAVMAALGEATHGGGMGQSIVAFFTLSTGFGGARIVNGKPDEKAVGFEPGDIIVGLTNQPIYLENLICGPALQKKYGKLPTQIDDPAVWEFVEKYLAIGLYDVVALWSPNIIVLGGPIATKLNFAGLNQKIKDNARKYTELPKVVPAGLGQDAGLYGALEYLKQSLH